MKRNQRGFNLVMLGVIIMAIVVAAFMVRHYWAGVLQQKYRQTADSIGKGLQYERGRSAATYNSGNTWEDKELECPDARDHIEDLENQKQGIILYIEQLEREIEELWQRADFLRQRGMELEFQALRLEMAAQVNPGLSEPERQEMLANAQALRDMTAELYAESANQQEEIMRREARRYELYQETGRIDNLILQIKQEFPQCFQ